MKVSKKILNRVVSVLAAYIREHAADKLLHQGPQSFESVTVDSGVLVRVTAQVSMTLEKAP